MNRSALCDLWTFLRYVPCPQGLQLFALTNFTRWPRPINVDEPCHFSTDADPRLTDNNLLLHLSQTLNAPEAAERRPAV
jgi:hypothetical protein